MQHANKTPDEIKAAYQHRFGHGWRAAMAEAMEISRATMSDWTPKLALSCGMILDLLDLIPVRKWPERWAKLASLAMKMDTKRKKDDAA